MKPPAWHPAILPGEQSALLPQLAQIPRHFILYGGTALALRLGHRISVDFDFFSAQPLVPDRLEAALPIKGSVIQKEENTLGLMTPSGVKLSFFGGLTFGQVADPEEFGGIRIASPADLYATKLNTLFQRAEAKDYLDIDALLNAGHSLEYGVGAALAIYGSTFNYLLPLKALTCFEQPSLAELPGGIKARLVEAVKQFSQPEELTCNSNTLS